MSRSRPGPPTPGRMLRLGRGLVVCVPVVFIGVLFGWPVLALVRRAVTSGSGESLGDLLGRTHAFHLLAVTVGQAAASTLLALLLAVPIVWLVARVDLPGATVLMVVVTVPFVLPTVVVGVAFRALVDGPLAATGLGDGWGAILAAHAFLNVAVVVRVVGAAWRDIDPRATEAARTLGAGRLRAFGTVVLPRLLPSVAAAGALVFLFCTTSFGVIVVLGNGRMRTLETEIYTQAISYFRIPEAVVLSLLQILVVVIALVVSGAVDGRRGVRTGGVSGRSPTTRPSGIVGWVAALACVAWTVLLLVGPLAVLAIRSVRPGAAGQWTLAGYRRLTESVNGVSPVQALEYSMATAAAAMLIAVAVGLAAAVGLRYARGLAGAIGDVAATVPLGVSAVTVGFGYLIVLSTLPYRVAASPMVIPCVQALIAVPVVIRIVLPALRAVPERTREAAATLGAGPIRVFTTVDLPAVGRSLGAAAGFAFIMALGEFGATGFLARADTTTLPVLIGSALNRPGADNLATAMAASMVLVVATAAAIVVVEVLRPRDARSVI